MIAKRLLVGIALGGLLSVAGGLTAKNVYVDASVIVSGDGTSPLLAFKTIGEALGDGNTLAGDTILIAPGTYDEGELDITKQLVIEGSGSGSNPAINTIIDGTTPGTPDGFNVLAGGTNATDRLVIRNLRIQDNSRRAISIEGNQDYITVENVAMVDNVQQGMELDSASDVTDLALINCVISGSGDGFRVEGNLDGLAITGGTITGNTNGIFVFQQVPPTATTQLINVVIDGTTISNNTLRGVYMEKLSNAVLRNVVVTNCGTSGAGSAGIALNLKYRNYSNISFFDITIDGCGSGDPTFGGGLLVKARDDAPTYSANPATLTGVLVEGGSITNCVTDGLRFGETNLNNAGPSNVVVRYVNISGNGTNSGLVNVTDSDIDARFNYWGDAIGPNTTLIDSVYGFYFGGTLGTGDRIRQGLISTGEVRFAPFWATPSGNDPVYVDLAFIGDAIGNDPAGPGTFIAADSVFDFEDAIGSVSEGGTINVANGTYVASNTVIDKALSFVGESRAGVVVAPAAVDGKADSSFGSNAQIGFIIRADDVTISTLTIDGEANNVALGQPATDNNYRTGILQDFAALYQRTTIQDIDIRGVWRRGIQIGTFDQLIGLSADNAINNCSISDVAIRQGIAFSANGTITGNTLTNICNTLLLGSYVGSGIYVEGSDIDVVGNTVSDFAVNGIFSNPGRYPALPHLLTIQGNDINTPRDSVGQVFGIYTPGLTDGSRVGGATPAEGNDIDLTGGTVSDDRIGIVVVDADTNVRFENNSVSSAGEGIGMVLIRNSTAPVVVSRNTLTSIGSTSTGTARGAGILVTDDALSVIVLGLADATLATLTNNTISGYVRGIDLYRAGTGVPGGYPLTVTIGGNAPSLSNTVTGCTTGVRVFDADGATNGYLANASVSNNLLSFTGNGVAIDVVGGTAAIVGNAIYNNGTGVAVSATGTVTNLASNQFDDTTNNVNEPDGDADNVVDLSVAADAGAITIGGGNNFAADRAAPFFATSPASAYYIENLSAQPFNLSVGQSFDGTSVGLLTLSEFFAAEDLIYHAIESAGLGLVRLRTGEVFVTANSGSIQNAIDAASSGDIVNIADGLYIASNTLVTKPLTIDGQSLAGVVIAPVAVDDKLDSTFGGNYQIGFIVQADDVTIRDLTIDGEANNVALSEPAGANNFRAGVLQDFAALYNTTIVDNCIIRGVVRRGVQIGTFNAVLGVSTGNEVTDSQISDVLLRQAIVLSGDGTISDNIISNIGDTLVGGVYLGSGIFSEGNNVVITDNTVSSFSLAGIYHDPDRYSDPSVLTIQGNIIQTPLDLQDDVYGMRLSGLDGGSIVGGPNPGDGNTIDMTSADVTFDRVGILAMRFSSQIAGSVSIEGNGITMGGDGAGIWLFRHIRPSSPVVVSDNIVSTTASTSSSAGLGTGVYMFDAGALVADADNPLYARLTGNTINGFVTGIDADSTADEMMRITVGGATPADNNSVSGCGVGIRVADATSFVGTPTVAAAITGNTASISASTTTAIELDGVSAEVTNNAIHGNPIGIRMLNGATALIEGNDFDAGANPDNLVDIRTETTAGDIDMSPTTENVFAGSNFFIEHLSPQDFDATFNRFKVISGTVFPGEMTAADQVELENRVYHDPDNAASGLILFNFLIKPETWVDDDWVGIPNGTIVTVPLVGNKVIGDAAFATIQLAYPATLKNGRINIFNGLYRESNTLLDKAVTLLGESEGGVVVAPAAEDDQDDSVFGGTPQNAFIIDAPRVVIEGLTIDGQANPALTAGKRNFRHGIVIEASNPPGLDNCVVRRVTMRNLFRRGMNLTTRSSGWLVDDVNIGAIQSTSFLDASGGGGFGIYMVDVDGTVQNSSITGADISIIAAHGQVNIDNNLLSGGRRALWLTYATEDEPYADTAALRTIGGFAFSINYNPAHVTPLGVASTIPGSPLQFEQLFTTPVGGNRLNIIGAVSDPANSSHTGDLFEIQFQNAGLPLISSDSTGIPDTLTLGDNPDVSPPHLVELDALSTAIAHVFVRGGGPRPAGVQIVYTVEGDALTPGGFFTLRASLENPATDPVVATVTDNTMGARDTAILATAVGDGTVIGGPAASDRNVISLIPSGGTPAVGIRAEYSPGALLIQNNEIVALDTDTGIWLHHNEKSAAPVQVRDNLLTSQDGVNSTPPRGNGIFLSDDGSFLGDRDSSNYAIIAGNEITGWANGIYVHRSASSIPGGYPLEVTVGGTAGLDANLITFNDVGIHLFEADGPSFGYLADVDIMGNGPISGNELVGVLVDGARAAIAFTDIRNNFNVGLQTEGRASVSVVDTSFFGNLSLSINNMNPSGGAIPTTNVYWGSSDGPAPFGSGFPILGDVSFSSVAFTGGLYNQAVPTGGGLYSVPFAFNDRFRLHSVSIPALDAPGTLRVYSPRNRHGVANATEVVLQGANLIGNATITLEYDPSTDITGLQLESDMRLHRWNGSAWIIVPGSTVDAINNTVSASVSSFSTYAVINAPGTAIDDWSMFD